MKLTGITPILNVSGVPASIAWFEKLGWTRGFSYNDGGMIECAADRNEQGPAQFAGICCGNFEVFLCKDGQGSRGGAMPKYLGDDDTGGVWMSLWVKTPAEVDEIHALAFKHGIFVSWSPTDEPWGCRECRICHPDGHTFRIAAPLPQYETNQNKA
jgi:uncharacterized glyoxalase superfamily protein PhnB